MVQTPEEILESYFGLNVNEKNYKTKVFPEEEDVMCMHFDIGISIKYIRNWFRARKKEFIKEVEKAKAREARLEKFRAPIEAASLKELKISLRPIPEHIIRGHQQGKKRIHASSDELAILKAAFKINPHPTNADIEQMMVENLPGRTFRYIRNWFYSERCKNKKSEVIIIE